MEANQKMQTRRTHGPDDDDAAYENIGMPPRKLLLSVEETTFTTGLSRTEIYDLMAAKILPFVMVGRRRLIAMDDLQEFIARHRQFDSTERTSKSSVARRQSLAKRYAAAERAEARRERASVRATGPATSTAAD